MAAPLAVPPQLILADADPERDLTEQDPLLPTNGIVLPATNPKSAWPQRTVRLTLAGVLTLIFIVVIVAGVSLWEQGIPGDPHDAALWLLRKAPVIVSLLVLRSLFDVDVYKLTGLDLFRMVI